MGLVSNSKNSATNGGHDGEPDTDRRSFNFHKA